MTTPRINRKPLAAITLAICTLFCGPSSAADIAYNQVVLQADAAQDVTYDLMEVTFYYEAQGDKPADLSNQVTQVINKAIEQARQNPAIQINQGSRSSQPLYADNDLSISRPNSKTPKGMPALLGWRERAELHLRSTDFSALATLSGQLMQTLSLDDMRFSLSDTARQKAENDLLTQLITTFKNRAQIVTQAMGGKDYKVVSLNLSNQGPMLRDRIMPMAAAAKYSEATPQVEGGVAPVSMSANGSIEILH